jgi:hypothetical protein
MVLESGLVLTTQTSVRPRQVPALKNDVCAETRFARFKPAEGSLGSRASKGNVMTARSTSSEIVEKHHHSLSSKQKHTRKDNQKLVFI